MLKPTFTFSKLAGAAAVLLATSPAAWAQLQAPTVWEDWQEVYNRFGGTLGADSTTYENGTLTLDGVGYRSEIGGVASTVNYGTITMVEQGDGSVNILIPAELETGSTTTAPNANVDQTIRFRHENLSIVAREDGEERTYDITADSMTAEIDTVVSPGGVAEEPVTVSIQMDGVESAYRSGLGADGQGLTQTYAIDGITVSSVIAPPGNDAGVTFSYALTDVTSDFDGSYGEAPTGPVRGLSDMNITYDGSVAHAGSTLSIAGNTPTGPLNIAGTSDSGRIDLSLGTGSLGYALSSLGAQMTVQVPGFPLPVNATMAEISSAFTLPIGEPGTEEPFGLQVALRDLTVDDVLWGLFDPTGQLPRDPATVVLDLDGTAVMNIDLFGDPQGMATLQGLPAVLKSLKLNELLVSLAGAELRGEGDVTFPTETLIPEPVGTVELALDGGFALLDRIVALGFVPAQQAAFLKGMSGAVTRQVGDDQLASTIEFTPGGGITANGLPLQ